MGFITENIPTAYKLTICLTDNKNFTIFFEAEMPSFCYYDEDFSSIKNSTGSGIMATPTELLQ